MKKFILVLFLLVAVIVIPECKAQGIPIEGGKSAYMPFEKSEIGLGGISWEERREMGPSSYIRAWYEFLDKEDIDPRAVEISLEQKEVGGEWVQMTHPYPITQKKPIVAYLIDKDRNGEPFVITCKVKFGVKEWGWHGEKHPYVLYTQQTEFRLKLENKNANPIVLRLGRIRDYDLVKVRDREGNYKIGGSVYVRDGRPDIYHLVDVETREAKRDTPVFTCPYTKGKIDWPVIVRIGEVDDSEAVPFIVPEDPADEVGESHVGHEAEIEGAPAEG